MSQLSFHSLVSAGWTYVNSQYHQYLLENEHFVDFIHVFSVLAFIFDWLLSHCL